MTRIAKPNLPAGAIPTTSPAHEAKRAEKPPEPAPKRTGWVPGSAAPVARPAARPDFPSAGVPAGGSAAAKLAEVNRLLEGHTDRHEEAQIISIFRGATPGELNEMLGSMSVHDAHELIDDMNDRWIGPDNRSAFLQLLAKDRLPDLSVDSRSKLLQALQHHATGGIDEKTIRDVFTGTKGRDLTALKNSLDQAGDYHDLQQMVFHDIDDPAIRSQLLSHFRKEAAPTGQVKVLSDIDDTFYVNFKDDRYPGKTVYPGVKQFYSELDKGIGATPDREGDLMFLSARPYDRAGVSESMTRDMLDKQDVTKSTVLSGDFAHLIGNDSIAAKKFDNWQQLRQLYPEYGSVFTGDSGQGDAIFGAKAAATSTDMQGVFIHNVTGLSDQAKADFAQKGVSVFDTYVGAATEAFKKGLITRAGLGRVAEAATRELDAVRFDDPAQAAARKADLARDLEAMRAALQ